MGGRNTAVVNGWPDYLRAAMTAAGIPTPAALAKRIGVNQGTVSRWMTGESQTDLKYLRKLAAVLHRPILELIVAAGHLEPAEARMSTRPVPPQPAEDVLERFLTERVAPAHRATARTVLRALEDPALTQQSQRMVKA